MEFRRVHKDKRGEIYVIEDVLPGDREITLLTTKRGYARGGCVHRYNDELFMLFSGRVSYKIGNEDDRIVEAGEIIEILAGSPHYFKALIDTVAVEWGATIHEKKEYDPPFRRIVDEINRKANSDAL